MIATEDVPSDAVAALAPTESSWFVTIALHGNGIAMRRYVAGVVIELMTAGPTMTADEVRTHPNFRFRSPPVFPHNTEVVVRLASLTRRSRFVGESSRNFAGRLVGPPSPLLLRLLDGAIHGASEDSVHERVDEEGVGSKIEAEDA